MMTTEFAPAAAQVLYAESPGGGVALLLTMEEGQSLSYSVRLGGAIVLEPSPLGITVDGVDFGEGLALGVPVDEVIDETYATRGWHRTARNACRQWTIPVTHQPTAISYQLVFRVYDDGVAYRYILPGTGSRRVQGEASGWKIPSGSKVWIAERNNHWKLKSYAGWWMSTSPEELQVVSSEGPVQAPPVVLELPGGVGYAALTEAALTNYSGMRLRAVGDRLMVADFTEGEAGFELEGPIETPWRVTIVAADLNDLVNSDLLTNLNPAADSELFSDTSWIKPGRVTWRWWSENTGNPEQERKYVDHARELGFEYSLVDDGWEAWPDKWDEVRAICEYASPDIGIFVWKDYKYVNDPADDYRQLREFLDGIQAAGVRGVKIDFMNAESKDRIDFQMAALRETAKRKLMLLFHGCQKPTGESRTWPHEVTREGIRGLELNKMLEGPIMAAHNAALPFTRFVAGHADYTPVGYSNPGETSWAHQLATGITFTSPMNVIAENPVVLLHDPSTRPALDVLKAMPSMWDETKVLQPSEIGELAIFARRTGSTWYVGAISGASPRTFEVDLSFLDQRTSWSGVFLSSPTRLSFQRREVHNIPSRLPVALAAADGFVAVFRPAS